MLLPPNLRTFGAQSFTAQDRETLRAWLAEAGWPRNTMDMTTLEGYLVGLLVWPVGVPCGAWLPPIWGEEHGWKVPAKIASSGAYPKFMGLIVGFLQHLDRGLSSSPPQFAPTTLAASAPRLRRHDKSHMSWSRGFLRALQQSSQGLQWRSNASRSAVASIAREASSTSLVTDAHSHSALVADLTSAVLTLAAERASRGPLGGLEHRTSREYRLDAVASQDSDSSARRQHD
jgi:yecA family protein